MTEFIQFYLICQTSASSQYTQIKRYLFLQK